MVTTGGRAFAAYDEFQRVVKDEKGFFRIVDRRGRRRHRMSIGTIVGDTMIAVKWRSGGLVGHVEEYFHRRHVAGRCFLVQWPLS